MTGLAKRFLAMAAALLALALLQLHAQAPARVLGSVTKASAEEMTLKTDAGEEWTITLPADAKIQKVAPGERDLSKAQEISASDIAAGDRVLARGTGGNGTLTAASVIVMTAREIAQKNDAEHKRWLENSLAGLVDSVDPAKGEIRLKKPGSDTLLIIHTDGKTNFHRYASDSVKFTDAKASSMTEVRKGDQLRALGEKNADGTEVKAEQVVFGTFKTMAGTITQVAENGELQIKELQSGKTVAIQVKPQSQLKKMAMMGGPGGPGMMAGRGTFGGGQGPMGAGQPGGPNTSFIASMIERLPAGPVTGLKPGDTVIVLSGVGDKADDLTAVVVVAGVERLLARLAAPAQGNGMRDNGPSLSGGNFGVGTSGLEGMLGVPMTP
jgi:hypothetical protein